MLQKIQWGDWSYYKMLTYVTCGTPKPSHTKTLPLLQPWPNSHDVGWVILMGDKKISPSMNPWILGEIRISCLTSLNFHPLHQYCISRKALSMGAFSVFHALSNSYSHWMCEGTSLATLNRMYLSFINRRCARCHGEFKWVLRFCNQFFKTTLVTLTTRWDNMYVYPFHMKQNILQNTSHGIGIFFACMSTFGASTTICWVSHSLCTHGMVDMLKLIVTTCKLKMWKKGCQPNTISSTSYVVFASHFSWLP